MTTAMVATLTIYVNTTVIMAMTMAMTITGTATMIMTIVVTKTIIMTTVAATAITKLFKQAQQGNFIACSK